MLRLFLSCLALAAATTAKPTGTTPTTKVTDAAKVADADVPSPTQDGLISTCKVFYQAVAGDSCQAIVAKYGTFKLADFTKWNPGVGDDCSGLYADFYYCVGIPGTPSKPTGPAGPSPTQDGIISTCKNYYKAKSGDSCQAIVDQYRTFKLKDFVSWNPAVGSDCSGLFVDYYYCVGVPGTPTQPTGPAGPSPTQDGIVGNCQKFYKAVSGDSCQVIVDKYRTFSLNDFTSWNPAVGKNCAGLFLGYYYCVGIPGTPSNPPPPTGCQRSVPSPTQPGALCECKRWHQVGNGDSCDRIEKQYGISADNFNRWNPKVGRDCSTLWLGYNVCVAA